MTAKRKNLKPTASKTKTENVVLRKFVCRASACTTGGKIYRYGEIVSAAKNPDTSYFTEMHD